MQNQKKSLDEYLKSVDYSYLNSSKYQPSLFALQFVNFIKLVNGEQGETNKTPPMHLKMLDTIAYRKRNHLVNLAFRGSSKTTVFGEYMTLYLAIFHELPGLKDITGMMYIADTMENGAKSLRKNIEHRYEHSEFLQAMLPRQGVKFTDNYLEFTNTDGKQFGVRLFGATALSLDSKLFTENGFTTIKDCQIGDYIYGPDGKLARIYAKSPVFYKPMYELVLKDGRKLKVSEDHINSLEERYIEGYGASFNSYRSVDLTTKELLERKLFKTTTVKPNKWTKGYTSNEPIYWVKNCEPIQYTEKDFKIDPYTVGLLLGDGGCSARSNGTFSVRLTGLEEDWKVYEQNIPYKLGKIYRDKRSPKVITRCIYEIKDNVKSLGLNKIYYEKAVPQEYFFGSIEQRLALLQGLMDTDGTVYSTGRICFTSTSKQLADGVIYLVRSLGGSAYKHYSDKVKGNRKPYFTVRIQINLPIFRLPRKLKLQQLKTYKDRVAVIAVNPIMLEPSQCIGIENTLHQYIAEDFFRTHNTGLRGTKIFGKRPQVAIGDDLLSDESAKSKTVMELIKDTVYKGIDPALDPNGSLVILSGTPFNKEDIIIEAVESGAWETNVYPICERFPCSREEFRGAWEDRFSYDYIRETYERYKLSGKLGAFYQELMLQITSEEERMVLDSEIRWYYKSDLMKHKSSYNFYITTDFATSSKTTADFSVISVWALNGNEDWYLVDCMVAKQSMDKTVDRLFELVQEYSPMQVGIEITGQQGAFITWLQREMMNRSIWFNFASSDKTGNTPGIRPITDKLSRFNLILPLFKAGKIYFPKEKQDSRELEEFMSELRLATYSGFKGHDDCLDTISQLAYLRVIKPSKTVVDLVNNSGIWEDMPTYDDVPAISSYIV